MKIINSMLLSVFSGIIFFCILLLGMSDSINILGLILLSLIFLPLLLSSFWGGIKSFLPIFIAIVAIGIFAINLSIMVIVIFLLPSLIISLAVLKIKDISASYILSIIIGYTTIICAAVLIYYGFINEQKYSIYNIIYDTITFLSIYANQYMGEEFRSLNNLPQQLAILAFIFPSIIAIAYIIWLYFNYTLAIKISFNDNDNNNVYSTNTYTLPNLYTYIFIILIICVLLVHNLLDKNNNLYYILYNVLFILCSGYFYTGFYFLWNKVKSRDSLLISILYVLFVIILFIEFIIIFSILGFIVEIKRVVFKNNTQLNQ